MAVLCGTASNETRLIMWKITLAQTMSCQAIRRLRRLSAQFKRPRDNRKQRWPFSDHDHATANWTAGFSSPYRTLCKVLVCPQKETAKILHHTEAAQLLSTVPFPVIKIVPLLITYPSRLSLESLQIQLTQNQDPTVKETQNKRRAAGV